MTQDEDAYQALIGNIRAEAARRNVRQADLAAAVGVSQAAMSLRMSGQQRFRPGDLDKLAELLGMSLTDLTGLSQDQLDRYPYYRGNRPEPDHALLAEVVGEIRAVMGRQHMNQAELARRLGVRPMWVSYRLSGETPLSLPDLAAIAEVLKVDLTVFLPQHPVPAHKADAA